MSREKLDAECLHCKIKVKYREGEKVGIVGDCQEKQQFLTKSLFMLRKGEGGSYIMPTIYDPFLKKKEKKSTTVTNLNSCGQSSQFTQNANKQFF